MGSITPEISIVMPVYNSERYLKQAIESILEQTFKNFEFLIIDDQSTDRSRQIATEYAQKDDRIRVISNSNKKGLVAALNLGIANSRAPWIARFDSDDICLPSRLDAQMTFLKNHPKIKVVGAFFTLFNEDGDIQTIKHPTHPLEISYKFTWNTRLGHPTVIFNKEIGIHLGGYPQMTAEDYAFFSQIAINHRIANVSHSLLKYRVHGYNKSSLEESDAQKDIVSIASQMLSSIHNRKISSEHYLRFHRRQPIPLNRIPATVALNITTIIRLTTRLKMWGDFSVYYYVFPKALTELMIKCMIQLIKIH